MTALRLYCSADLAPRWTDETQPRTDRPLFFIPSELYQRARRSSKAPERSHLSEHPRRASIALASTTN